MPTMSGIARPTFGFGSSGLGLSTGAWNALQKRDASRVPFFVFKTELLDFCLGAQIVNCFLDYLLLQALM